jgi:purine-binding chemotaxis protein CheW
MTESSKGRIDWEAVRARITRSTNALNNTLTFSEDELAKLYNDRAARLAKGQDGETTAAPFSVLVFRVAKESYAIDLNDLVEIVSYRNCTPVPDCSESLLGLISVRGEIRPVLDLARLLEIEHEHSTAGYVLMVRTHGTVVGLKVDHIEQVRDLYHDEVSFNIHGNAEMDVRHLKGVTQDTLMLIDVVSLTQQLVSQ